MPSRKHFESTLHPYAVLCGAVFSLTAFFAVAMVGIHATKKEVVVPIDIPVTTASSTVIQKEIRGVLAKSYIVYDPILDTVTAERDSRAVRPLASVTKVMTSYLAHSLLPRTEKIQIEKEDLSPEGESGLEPGDMWTPIDLIHYTLTVSSNDGARALARSAGATLVHTHSDTSMSLRAFYAAMNEMSEKYGLSSMHFNNESGLDIAGVKNGGYASAADMARFMGRVYLTAPELFDTSTETRATIHSQKKTYRAQNTNRDATTIVGLAASKTGFTALAQGNLAVVVERDLGHPLVIVVLGSTIERRFSDVEKLIDSVTKE